MDITNLSISRSHFRSHLKSSSVVSNESFIFPKMSSSLCPHLVQEYFERVADILSAYRPQILKQVEYDKISENLVLRGAVRQEEHLKIFQCADLEGQVSQMLVVIQNRMWGLENLLAACMEEHVSSWLSHELFRAYMEHLVGPLRKQRENPTCQCVQVPNSILYRGWVRALKSLDSLILKTGTSLGFMKQSMYPNDNMLTFLSEKLAEYTGGDSRSSVAPNQDDLIPYGFAPIASGEVQVAELEDDDINDLFSLSETLCIGYHSSDDNMKVNATKDEDDDGLMQNSGVKPTVIKKDSMGSRATIGKPVQRKVVSKRKGTSSRATSSDSGTHKETRFSEHETTDSDPQPKESQDKDKLLARQKELIARLSAPKSQKTANTKTSSTTKPRNSPSSSGETKQTLLSSTPASKQRPRSGEFHRSSSIATSTPASSIHANAGETKATAGKTHGFVRSRSLAATSPNSKGSRVSSKSKPMAIATPTVSSQKSKTSEKTKPEKEFQKDLLNCSGDADEYEDLKSEDEEPEILSRNRKLFHDKDEQNLHAQDETVLPEMAELFLSKTILANDEQEKAKNLANYQLCFDSFSDDDNE